MVKRKNRIVKSRKILKKGTRTTLVMPKDTGKVDLFEESRYFKF